VHLQEQPMSDEVIPGLVDKDRRTLLAEIGRPLSAETLERIKKTLIRNMQAPPKVWRSWMLSISEKIPPRSTVWVSVRSPRRKLFRVRNLYTFADDALVVRDAIGGHRLVCGEPCSVGLLVGSLILDNVELAARRHGFLVENSTNRRLLFQASFIGDVCQVSR
jgi:hypothetical protein